MKMKTKFAKTYGTELKHAYREIYSYKYLY